MTPTGRSSCAYFYCDEYRYLADTLAAQRFVHHTADSALVRSRNCPNAVNYTVSPKRARPYRLIDHYSSVSVPPSTG